MNTRLFDKKQSVDVIDAMKDIKIILVDETINSEKATTIISQLIFHHMKNKSEKITFILNVSSCDITCAFSIYDTLKLLTCEVEIMLSGGCCPEATLILSSGTKGLRSVTKNSLIELKELDYYEVADQTMPFHDMKRVKKLIDDQNEKFLNILSENTGKSVKEIKTFLADNRYLNADQALELGVVDAIL